MQSKADSSEVLRISRLTEHNQSNLSAAVAERPERDEPQLYFNNANIPISMRSFYAVSMDVLGHIRGNTQALVQHQVRHPDRQGSFDEVTPERCPVPGEFIYLPYGPSFISKTPSSERCPLF